MTRKYHDANCIITGGGGFLGQNLVEELIGQGSTVTVVDNFSYGADRSVVADDAEIVEGDIRDEETLKRLPDQEYHYLFHFAAPSSIINFDVDARECTEITVNGFLNVVRWAINNDVRLVYPSTGSLYSGTSPPHSEDADLDIGALNAYAKAKLSIELIHGATGELDAVCLRIFAGYGPEEAQKGDHASVIHLFARDIVNGERPMIYGDGTQERDFIFADDVVKAALEIGRRANEQVVNVGSGRPAAFNEVVELINDVNGSDVVPEYVDTPSNYLERTEADTTTMERYYPELEYSLKEGIAEVVRSLTED